MRISAVKIPKGTEITFNGVNDRKYKGKLAKSYSAWELDRSATNQNAKEIKFIDTPTIIPEKRKRIYVGGYVVIENDYIFKVTSDYFIQNEHSLFKGIGIYTFHKNKWYLNNGCPNAWYSSETNVHHSKIKKSFKDEESLNKFLMLENL